MLKLGVRKKGSLSYCVRKGYILSYWRTLRAQSGLKLALNAACFFDKSLADTSRSKRIETRTEISVT